MPEPFVEGEVCVHEFLESFTGIFDLGLFEVVEDVLLELGLAVVAKGVEVRAVHLVQEGVVLVPLEFVLIRLYQLKNQFLLVEALIGGFRRRVVFLVLDLGARVVLLEDVLEGAFVAQGLHHIVRVLLFEGGVVDEGEVLLEGVVCAEDEVGEDALEVLVVLHEVLHMVDGLLGHVVGLRERLPLLRDLIHVVHLKVVAFPFLLLLIILISEL
mmetsp:Transcript_20562/g.19542  ORF Transcript_20562/g.19542 Transcript_20562/m.19542 type:complete len:213 (-) Transcript_20562:201-839(-)